MQNLTIYQKLFSSQLTAHVFLKMDLLWISADFYGILSGNLKTIQIQKYPNKFALNRLLTEFLSKLSTVIYKNL